MKFIEYVRLRRHTRTQNHKEPGRSSVYNQHRKGMKYYSDSLHGDRFYAWFDSTFGLQAITINTNTNISSSGDTKSMTKRIQEAVSDEAKSALVQYAEKHKISQADALDEILTSVELKTELKLQKIKQED